MSFDLKTQNSYDLFSHTSFVNLNNLILESVEEDGTIKLSKSNENLGAYLRVVLKTEKNMLYLYEIEGKLLETGVASIFVERVDNKNSLLQEEHKFGSGNGGSGDDPCKYLCQGFEKFNLRFKAKSGLTAVGITLDQDANCLSIRKFNVTKLDKCLSESASGSCSYSYSYSYDSDDSSFCSDSSNKCYPQEAYPVCETHGKKCPACDCKKYGNPDICPTHGPKCPTFDSDSSNSSSSSSSSSCE